MLTITEGATEIFGTHEERRQGEFNTHSTYRKQKNQGGNNNLMDLSELVRRQQQKRMGKGQKLFSFLKKKGRCGEPFSPIS